MPRVQPVPVDQLKPRARAMLQEGFDNGAYNDNSGQLPPSMRTLAWLSFASSLISVAGATLGALLVRRLTAGLRPVEYREPAQ